MQAVGHVIGIMTTPATHCDITVGDYGDILTFYKCGNNMEHCNCCDQDSHCRVRHRIPKVPGLENCAWV